ncbi:hypothetical protein CAEBREN_10007 [Caenorhabditis brenneri]|uniref:Uncharacterized protein n=1 Tax=Caenorhabditis brenneri TaxID=135651 RepID=G0N987_CAEBE|nr:hypothetical protein CAEBREN_10007 [Caenorhabditis brenneri]
MPLPRVNFAKAAPEKPSNTEESMETIDDQMRKSVRDQKGVDFVAIKTTPVIQHAPLRTSAQLNKRLTDIYPDTQQKRARNAKHDSPFSSQPPPFRFPSYSRSGVFMTPALTPARPLVRYALPIHGPGHMATPSPDDERLRSLWHVSSRQAQPTPKIRSFVHYDEDVGSYRSSVPEPASCSSSFKFDETFDMEPTDHGKKDQNELEEPDQQSTSSTRVHPVLSGPLTATSTFVTPSEKSHNNLSFTVELLHISKKYGRLPPELIDDVIDRHKDEPNFSEEYKVINNVLKIIEILSKNAINKLASHIGDLSPTEGNTGMNFWLNTKVASVEKTYEKALANAPPQKLFDSISEPMQVDTEHSELFQKTGPVWKSGWKTTTALTTYPSDGLRCISKVIKYLLFELTNDPEDILFFTVKEPSNQDLSLIPMPQDVYEFIRDYMFNSVGFPLDILEPDMNLGVFEQKYPRKFESMGSTIVEQMDALKQLRKDANTFRLLNVQRISKILSDNRYKIIKRTESGLKFEKMNQEQKRKFKGEFETPPNSLVYPLGKAYGVDESLSTESISMLVSHNWSIDADISSRIIFFMN